MDTMVVHTPPSPQTPTGPPDRADESPTYQRLVEVQAEATLITRAGRLRIFVACPWCSALHRHVAPSDTEPLDAPCLGGRYRVTWGSRDQGRAPVLVPCRHFIGELCVSCGPDVELLYPSRVFGLAGEVVA